MQVCARCGRESADDARFCAGCGAPLDEEAPRREERKVVSVVFVDLVGSTAQAERLDMEDVRAKLAAYHARVRDELERHGGTVEKFIGDAVVAVFGAPVVHEDDAERAVRAALAIRTRCARTGRRACGSPSTPARRSSRSMRGRPRARAWSPATSSTPPPGSSRRAGRRDPRRGGHLPGDGARDRVPGGRAARGEGQDRAIAAWEAVVAALGSAPISSRPRRRRSSGASRRLDLLATPSRARAGSDRRSS